MKKILTLVILLLITAMNSFAEMQDVGLRYMGGDWGSTNGNTIDTSFKKGEIKPYKSIDFEIRISSDVSIPWLEVQLIDNSEAAGWWLELSDTCSFDEFKYDNFYIIEGTFNTKISNFDDAKIHIRTYKEKNTAIVEGTFWIYYEILKLEYK
jgi:hypothetical protein